MQGISKETFLKANDPKNRDAMLFDLLGDIDEKVDVLTKVKDDLARCEKQISYIKGIGAAIAAIFAGLLTWLTRG